TAADLVLSSQLVRSHRTRYEAQAIHEQLASQVLAESALAPGLVVRRTSVRVVELQPAARPQHRAEIEQAAPQNGASPCGSLETIYLAQAAARLHGGVGVCAHLTIAQLLRARIGERREVADVTSHYRVAATH